MTNWLDPAEVSTQTLSLSYRNEGAAWCVLEAIAALPEPHNGCTYYIHAYGRCDIPMRTHAEHVKDHEYSEPDLHRIWRVARVVCGKED